MVSSKGLIVVNFAVAQMDCKLCSSDKLSKIQHKCFAHVQKVANIKLLLQQHSKKLRRQIVLHSNIFENLRIFTIFAGHKCSMKTSQEKTKTALHKLDNKFCKS